MSTRVTFVTCGSVDDGKSTLIGRLLYDAGRLYDDQLEDLQRESRRYGTQGDDLDFALVVDGLRDERSQGITIDVAYRYFSTASRSFRIADSPGHEQYTKNMAMAASTADAAVLLVDARRGIVSQTMRHMRILAIIGVPSIALAVNKMDLVGWSREVFEEISESFIEITDELGFKERQAIAVSALSGANIFTHGGAEWCKGPSLVDWLESVPPVGVDSDLPALLPVQLVLRPSTNFRGYCGRLARGMLSVGDALEIAPSSARVTISGITVAGDESDSASAGQSVCITLEDNADVTRGDVLCAVSNPSPVASLFLSDLIWVAPQPLILGKSYWFKMHHVTVNAAIKQVRHRIDVDSGALQYADRLEMNDLAEVSIELDRAVAYEPYGSSRPLGGFILIDRMDCSTVAAGMIKNELAGNANISWEHLTIDKGARASLKGQRPLCVWLTGLSGAGKSTIADVLERRLHSMGLHTYTLDGDNIRHGLSKDLGFSDVDRVENIRRIAEVSRLFVDAGLIAIVAMISPYKRDRESVRTIFGSNEFIEVFVDAPVAVCEARDPKGLYRKARSGEIPEFTGISSPYEPPANPELRLGTDELGIEECVSRIVEMVMQRQSPGDL